MFPLYPKSWQRAAVLAIIAAILAVGVCAWGYTVDDAFIVARYATRLAHGAGYTFTSGPATDGITGPLWILPGWIAALAGGDPVWAAKATGLACAVLACAAWVHRLSRRFRGTCYALLAAALLACQPTLGGWAVAGLETSAAALGVTTAMLAVTARPRVWRGTLGVALAVLPWLRPELLVSCGVLALAAVSRLGWRRAVPIFAISGFGVGALVAFRLALFGTVVPLAFHAKQGSLGHGVEYTLRGVLVAFGVFGGVLLWRGAARGRADERLAATVVVAHLAAIVLAGGDWMPGFRLFAPVLPIALGCMAVGALRPARGAARYVWLGLALATACVLCVDLWTRVPEWHAAAASRALAGRALAEQLRRRATRVALVDIGYLGYASGIDVIDLGGITDPEIARMPGGHLEKRIPSAWLRSRRPDALVLHSERTPLVAADGRLLAIAGYPVEQRVAAFAWVRSEFRVAAHSFYAPGYHYVLLLRADRLGAPPARPAGD